MARILIRNRLTQAIQMFEDVALPVNMSSRLSNGQYDAFFVSEAGSVPLVITNGILDFPWQGFAKADFSIPSAITIPAGVNEFWIPVDVIGEFHQSAYVRLDVSNVNGGNINVASGAVKAAFTPQVCWVWSPGDDARQWIRIARPTGAGISFSDGRFFNVSFARYGSAATEGSTVTCRVTFSAAEPPQVITPAFHRPLRKLNLSAATIAYDFNPLTERWHDSGKIDGQGVWRSRLSHGYAQPGNGETGIHLNEDVPAFAPVVQNPFSRGADEFGNYLRLHTYAFESDFTFNSSVYKHQAAMLQGQFLDAACGPRGVWRMRAITADRAYAWPAFWLVGRNDNGSAAWPPEIDIMEQFNKAWGEDYPMTGKYTTCAQHYGNWGTGGRIGAHGTAWTVTHLPGVAADTSLWTAPHTYSACVDPDANEVTIFFDDVEILCSRLIARHQNMEVQGSYYPKMNVAVRAPSWSTPASFNADGTGDMRIYGMTYHNAGWSFDDIAWT